MNGWMSGLMRLGLLFVALCGSAYAAHKDQPFALEGIGSLQPFAPQDLRLGAGLDFKPAQPTFWRADIVQHQAGLSLCHRFSLADAIELSGGIGCYYDFTRGGPILKRLVPNVTIGHITF